MTKPEIRIRRATAADAAGIAVVHVASWQHAYRGVMPDSVIDRLDAARRAENWKRSLSHPRGATVAFVAVTSIDEIIGFVSGGPPQTPEPKGFDSELYAIYLLPEYMRQGIGRRLAGAFVVYMQSQGSKTMVLWVLQANPGSRAFYEALGGKLAGEKMYDVGGTQLPVVAYGWDDLAVLLA